MKISGCLPVILDKALETDKKLVFKSREQLVSCVYGNDGRKRIFLLKTQNFKEN